MKTVGIICECNPFHGGHEYLIQCARASGADCVIAVMSGLFVQRGEAAIADPSLRARAVLAGGADLVVELPFPYSAAPAEFFARAGVEILAAIGADELWFGSECGDVDHLSRLISLIDTDAFRDLYARYASGNSGTAEAYLRCIAAFAGELVTLSSNDLLGLAYLRAIGALGAAMKPVTVKRRGSAYLDRDLHDEYPSATALRAKWKTDGVGAILPFLPVSVREIYGACDSFADLAYAERLILGTLRLSSADALESVAVLSGGLGSRLKKAAAESASLDELRAQAATKKYPNARILRGILYALTDIGDADLRTPPAYTRLLAANAVGCEFLATHRKTRSFPILTRRTELPKTPEAERQAELQARAESLYALCHSKPRAVTSGWEFAPYIENIAKGH